MAIEKTVFTGTTQAANAPEVYEFLNANKAGYFDSVVMDETTNNVTCYAGETAALLFGFNGSSSAVVKITLANGESASDTRSAGNSTLWLYGIKTSKGLALRGAGTSEARSIIISKTDSGSLAIIAQICKTSSATTLAAADILHGAEFISTGGTTLNGSTNPISNSGLTTLTQIPLSKTAEIYAPDVYITFFGQYIGTAGKLAANGKEYYYTGYIALGD